MYNDFILKKIHDHSFEITLKCFWWVHPIILAPMLQLNQHQDKPFVSLQNAHSNF